MLLPNLNFEKELWNLGFNYICGTDEVGRGSFAGPLVVAAVIFPKNISQIDGVADSKLLNPKKRVTLAKRVKREALSWAIAEIGVSVINKVGIGKATQMGFRKVTRLLSPAPDFVLVDAFYIKHFKRKKQKAIIKGDQKSFSIAAASIIAKVYRDKLMKNLHKNYPEFGFSKHKGYGTKFHQDAIKKYGLSKIHRKSFNLGKFL